MSTCPAFCRLRPLCLRNILCASSVNFFRIRRHFQLSCHHDGLETFSAALLERKVYVRAFLVLPPPAIPPYVEDSLLLATHLLSKAPITVPRVKVESSGQHLPAGRQSRLLRASPADDASFEHERAHRLVAPFEAERLRLVKGMSKFADSLCGCWIWFLGGILAFSQSRQLCIQVSPIKELDTVRTGAWHGSSYLETPAPFILIPVYFFLWPSGILVMLR